VKDWAIRSATLEDVPVLEDLVRRSARRLVEDEEQKRSGRAPRTSPLDRDLRVLDETQTEEARQIATVVTLPTAIGYNHWVAPEVPADRLEMLRKAYAASLKDPELLADAKKQMLEIRPKTAAELDALVKKAAAVPQPVLDQTAKILEW
jgi:hypothetical protein